MRFHLQGWNIKEKCKNIRQQLRMNKPEIKILLALCYYIFLGAFILAALTVPASNYSQYVKAVSDYFHCESTGFNPNKKVCERNFEEFDGRTVFTIGLCFLGMFPIFNLLYILNVQEIKKILSRPLERRRTQHSLTQLNFRVASSAETL